MQDIMYHIKKIVFRSFLFMYFEIFLFVRNALDTFLGYRKKEIFEGIFFFSRNTDWALPGQETEEGDFLLLCAFVSPRDF